MKRKRISPYIIDNYKESSIKGLIKKQYGNFLLIKLPSGLYSYMSYESLGDLELEQIYLHEVSHLLPAIFLTKLEAEGAILNLIQNSALEF